MAAPTAPLLRATWTTAYWCLNERTDMLSFGFAPDAAELLGVLDQLVEAVERAAHAS